MNLNISPTGRLWFGRATKETAFSPRLNHRNQESYPGRSVVHILQAEQLIRQHINRRCRFKQRRRRAGRLPAMPKRVCRSGSPGLSSLPALSMSFLAISQLVTCVIFQSVSGVIHCGLPVITRHLWLTSRRMSPARLRQAQARTQIRQIQAVVRTGVATHR